jgi:hypothetical protein
MLMRFTDSRGATAGSASRNSRPAVADEGGGCGPRIIPEYPCRHWVACARKRESSLAGVKRKFTSATYRSAVGRERMKFAGMPEPESVL